MKKLLCFCILLALFLSACKNNATLETPPTEGTTVTGPDTSVPPETPVTVDISNSPLKAPEIISFSENGNVWRITQAWSEYPFDVTLAKDWQSDGGGSLWNQEKTQKVWFGEIETLSPDMSVWDLFRTHLGDSESECLSFALDSYSSLAPDGTKREVLYATYNYEYCYSYSYFFEILEGEYLTVFFYTYTGQYEPEIERDIFRTAVASIVAYTG